MSGSDFIRAGPIGVGRNDPPPRIRVSVGRIVRYVLPENGALRGAFVVRTFLDPALVNLRVMVDEDEDANDFGEPYPSWRSAVHYGTHAQRGTWHWPAGT